MEPENNKEAKKGDQKRIKRYVYWIVFFSIIIYSFFFTRYNIFNYWQTKRLNKQLTEELRSINLSNNDLKKQIEELRSDPAAWERIAREKFGMQKPDEIIIKFERDED